MSKLEFLAQLRKGLSGLPQDEVEDSLLFYSEMIDDYMEDGLSEEEAISAVGSVDDIVALVVAETPFMKIAKERIKPNRRLKTWEIVALVVTFPIWISLALVALELVLVVFATIWIAVIVLWVLFVSSVLCALAGVVAGTVIGFTGNPLTGLAVAGAGLVCAGLSVFLFYGSVALTKGVAVLSKRLAVWIKGLFIKKEVA